MATITYAGLSDLGRTRPQNEDRWYADPERGVFIVADGMGGTVAGALAAQIIVETLPLLLRRQLADPEDLATSEVIFRVRSVVIELSECLLEASRGRVGLDGLGSTLVLALIRDGKSLIAHLGDSRAYLARRGRLERLTRDHSLVQLLFDCSEISSAEAADHPARGRLTRYVGMKGDVLPDVRSLELCRGDRLLLCSDGLTTMLGDDELLTILKKASHPQEACQRLVAAANAAGGTDNITAVVIAISGVSAWPDQDFPSPVS